MRYYGLKNNPNNLYKKKVLLRVDWNVSRNEQGEINEFKIQASIRTIRWLVEQGATVIIVTHWSRPKGFEYTYSTFHFVKTLKRYGCELTFIPTVSLISQFINGGGTIFLLENIRFLPHEKACSTLLAKELFSLVDFFVQDGFGILAKEACCSTVLPILFEKDKRCIGFLIEDELYAIDCIRRTSPLQNALLIGGAKVPEKLKALKAGLSVALKVALLPPLVATYEAALGRSYGDRTVIFKNLFSEVYSIIDEAKKRDVKILVPIDFQVKTKQGLFKCIDRNEVDADDQIIGIGPKTVNYYAHAFGDASHLFMTGISGFIDEKESWYTGSMLFNALKPGTKRIIAGGDSVALMQAITGQTNPYNSVLLTGGSASFGYLGTGQLIGLFPFKKEGIDLKS